MNYFKEAEEVLRRLPKLEKALEMLYKQKEHIEKNQVTDLLFTDKNKKAFITTSQVNMAFKRLCQKYGDRIYPP